MSRQRDQGFNMDHASDRVDREKARVSRVARQLRLEEGDRISQTEAEAQVRAVRERKRRERGES